MEIVVKYKHTCLYLSTLTPSSWLRRTRLVPTRILSSCRSFSLFSLSRLWPWCCILTHNLFISAKFRRTKSIESLMSPVISSDPLWGKGRKFRIRHNIQQTKFKTRQNVCPQRHKRNGFIILVLKLLENSDTRGLQNYSNLTGGKPLCALVDRLCLL